MAANTTCEDYGMRLIATAEECGRAAEQVRLADTIAGTAALGDEPQGCYRYNGGSLWFKRRIGGPSHRNAEPICRQGTLHNKQDELCWRGPRFMFKDYQKEQCKFGVLGQYRRSI